MSREAVVRYANLEDYSLPGGVQRGEVVSFLKLSLVGGVDAETKIVTGTGRSSRMAELDALSKIENVSGLRPDHTDDLSVRLSSGGIVLSSGSRSENP